MLPRKHRETALLGLTMYTASRPVVIRAQQVAFAVVRALGPAVLPARRTELAIGEWDALVSSWNAELGQVSSVAMYQRKDPRAGLTMLVGRDGAAPVLVKCRRDSAGISTEQRMLAEMSSRAVAGLNTPLPAGEGVTADGLAWAAQEFVFRRPHRPQFELDPSQLTELGEAVSECLTTLGRVPPREDWVPVHGDLTPWNLRRDHEDRIWLIDWEDVGFAPQDADSGYLSLSAAALRGTTLPALAPEVVDYWSAVVAERVGQGHPQAINHAMLALLEGLSQPS